MKNIRVILKRLFAIFLCTGIISCSAYGKYTVAYAAGEELVAGLIGYIPFSTAFFSAAAALGVTGASLAGVLSQENGNADLTAAQKVAERSIAQQGGLKTLSNGVNIVKTYVSGKVNYFSNAFMTAVAEALNSKGLFTSKSASVSMSDKYGTIKLTSDNFYSLSEILSIPYFDYQLNISGIAYWNDIVFPALKSHFGDDYSFLKFEFSTLSDQSQYIYFIKKSDIDSFPVLNYSFVKQSSSIIQTIILPRFTVYYAFIPSSSSFSSGESIEYGSYYMSSSFLKYTDWSLSSGKLTVDKEYYVTKPLGEISFSPAWSVTSNLPKFGASALLETMPTWAGATTTIPAGAVDSSTEEQVAYPVTIPAGDKALTNGLTADDLQDLTQDQAQAGSIDTTTDITDLSAVTQAITGAADQTAANFDTLFGWLDQILSAIKAIPAAIADAISSAFAFQQSSFDGLILPTEITKKFPFCIPFDIADCLRLFQTDEREAPHYEYTLKYSDQANTIVIDLSQFDDIAKLVRSLEFIGFLVGLAFATRYLIRG